MHTLGGWKIVLDHNIPSSWSGWKPRSWKERLFTRPWKPWVSKTWVDIKEEIYKLGEDRLAMHPVTYKKLQETFNDTQ